MIGTLATIPAQAQTCYAWYLTTDIPPGTAGFGRWDAGPGASTPVTSRIWGVFTQGDYSPYGETYTYSNPQPFSTNLDFPTSIQDQAFYHVNSTEYLVNGAGPSFVNWFKSQTDAQLFTTAVTQAEVLYGISLLPKGSRREKLFSVAQLIFDEDLQNRILPFSSEAASHYADIGSSRRISGRPISQFDAMIAAIARLHGATIATRNTSDFDHCGINLINPWEI